MATLLVTAYLSLGSNLGDREGYLRRACLALKERGIVLRRFSSIYETEPVDFRDQGWFLNCVVEVETTLPPLPLLRQLESIEAQLGRQRELPKGPRTIDIDILFYGDLTLHSRELVIPHPRMLQRRFVLEPLREIAPRFQWPASSKTVEDFSQGLQDPSRVRRVSEVLAP